jgi:hypothetical protein
MADTGQQSAAELALATLQSQTPSNTKGAAALSVLESAAKAREEREARDAERSASLDSTTTEKKKTSRPYLEGDVLNKFA